MQHAATGRFSNGFPQTLSAETRGRDVFKRLCLRTEETRFEQKGADLFVTGRRREPQHTL